MSIEEKIKALEKLEKKKKWENTSKVSIDIANYYFEEKDYTKSLEYYERGINATENLKKAKTVIILYRKAISVAKKGRKKTAKELFRLSAKAIPLIEEYIQVLKESKRYITKEGAQIRYLLGECREIVSGIQSRNKEFREAGLVFVDVGKRLSQSRKPKKESDEAFERSRAIFELIAFKEDLFDSLLIEADLCIRNLRLDRGFQLFEEARSSFDDEEHQVKVSNAEKIVYAEMGLQLLQDHYTVQKQREIANVLIGKAREAYVFAKSLDEFSKIQFEIGKIHLENNQLENAFTSFDEAIENSELVSDEATPRQIVEYLFQQGKIQAEKVLDSPPWQTLQDIEGLLPIQFFSKLESICRKTAMNQEAEEVALYIWQMGLDLLEKKAIRDDFLFIKKSISILISHSRISGLHKIGDQLEVRLDDLAEKRKIPQLEKLNSFLTSSYIEIGDKESAGWLNVKTARKYATWGDVEKQLSLLKESAFHFQQADPDTLKAFSEALMEQYQALKVEFYEEEFLELLSNTYLLLKDVDRYDSLYAQHVLKLIETEEYSKALEFHRKNLGFLRASKNIPRALKRIEEVISVLISKNQLGYAINVRKNQVDLLITTEADQEVILQTIENLEDLLHRLFEVSVSLPHIDEIYQQICTLYDYIRLTEAKGDTAFEIGAVLVEEGNIEAINEGFKYLETAIEVFSSETLVEKCGLVLDFVSNKKDLFETQGKDQVVVKCLEFLVNSVRKLGQVEEAANLMIDRVIQLVQLNDAKAFEQFEEAKRMLIQANITEKEGEFYQKFGSALLRAGQVERGMEMLSKAQQSPETNSLAIADTCLSVAEDSFTDQDYDTYFILVDRALSIYTDLEMYKESYSIALSEANKLWSVGNLPYTMIYLERAWAAMVIRYDESLSESIQPLVDLAEEIIAGLFIQKKYDEVVGFVEFQERIYRHFNWMDKILEVDRRKIDAMIGKGNIDLALSRVLDIASLGIEETKFIETISVLRDYLPTFIVRAPSNSDTKFILKMLMNLIITMVKEGAQKLAYENIDDYLTFIIDSLKKGDIDSVEKQTTLIFNALTEIAEAEDILGYYTVKLCQELTNIGEIVTLFKIIEANKSSLEPLKSELRLKIIDQISLILNQPKLSEELLSSGLNLIEYLSTDLNDNDRDNVIKKLIIISKEHKEFRDRIKNMAFNQSKQTERVSSKINLLYGLIKDDLESENYLNAMKMLDETIDLLKTVEDPKIYAKRFLELLNRILIDLAKRKKVDWLDLLSTKQKIIIDKFLGGDGDDFASITDKQLSEELIDDMLSLTRNKERKQKD